MPPKAEVFIADKSQRWQANYSCWLPRGGHHVAGAATSIDEAQILIGKLKENGAQIDVAIIDKSLARSKHRGQGASIYCVLRREYPAVKVIATIPNGTVGINSADLYVDKDDIEPKILNDLIKGA
jgi:hypothetical protein